MSSLQFCLLIWAGVSIYAIEGAFDVPKIEILAKKCSADPGDTEVVKKYQVPDTQSGKCLMLCFSKELAMLNSNDTYDEIATLNALKKYWAEHKTQDLESVNSACFTHAKKYDTEAGSCEYGYQIMKCINSEFIKLSLLTPLNPPTA